MITIIISETFVQILYFVLFFLFFIHELLIFGIYWTNKNLKNIWKLLYLRLIYVFVNFLRYFYIFHMLY